MPGSSRARRWALATMAALALPLPGVAQERTAAPAPLRVFLDCRRCDFDHLRREVDFVDYVRDAADAQVHVLVTDQDTGAGGEEYTLFLIGQGEFAAHQDTVRFTTSRDDTDEEVRAVLTRRFALALVPYALRTPVASGLSLNYERDEGSVPQGAARDPWNLWVFRVGVGASVEGESRQDAASFDGSWSASRTTESVKVDLSAYGRYTTDRFELNEGGTRSFTTRDYELEGMTVWSLGTHLSAGVFGSGRVSTRQNQDLALELAPAIEYNLYPYTESTRRQILFTYRAGAVHYRYDELTLYDRLRETLGTQSFEISAGFQQPWGEIDGSVEFSNYLDDFAKHRLELDTGLEFRVFRGFSLDVRGNVARIKDQRYIPREDLTDEEILLELRELGTDFEYELDVGFSYSFGSPFNNVVNPRLRQGGF